MRDFSSARRIVVKIGTNVLSSQDGLDERYVDSVADQVAALMAESRQVLLVTSGAIGMGARELGMSHKVTSVKMRQACAAIGQPLLMNTYKRAFSLHDITVAQVLLTREVLNNRKSYVNLRNSVESLLELHVLPVFNENDSVSTAEIGTAFGDNDQLSAFVASKVDADLLVMLSDIDALYDKDPRKHADARPIQSVEVLTDEILKAAGKAGSTFATGGMTTKMKAVSIAGKAGCRVVLAHGREPQVITRVVAGEEIGTLFHAGEKLKNRTRWIMNSEAKGRILIDEGALTAIEKRNSLLPTGIHAVEGVFEAGSVVEVRCPGRPLPWAKVVTGLNSTDLESVIGKRSNEVNKTLGPRKKDIIARPEDIVLIQR